MWYVHVLYTSKHVLDGLEQFMHMMWLINCSNILADTLLYWLFSIKVGDSIEKPSLDTVSLNHVLDGFI